MVPQAYADVEEHPILQDDSKPEHEENEELFEEDGSSTLSIPTEPIDFDMVYALHSFAATVEGQANVVKGDNLYLMDDTNSYWWLVRVLKTQEVGYIPAENIETPFERLARLNRHRNIDLVLATQAEQQESSHVSQDRARCNIQSNPGQANSRNNRRRTIHFNPIRSNHRYIPPLEEDEVEDEDDEWLLDGYEDADEELASEDTYIQDKADVPGVNIDKPLPVPPYLSEFGDVDGSYMATPGPNALADASSISNLTVVQYPEGVNKPRFDISEGAKDRKFGCFCSSTQTIRAQERIEAMEMVKKRLARFKEIDPDDPLFFLGDALNTASQILSQVKVTATVKGAINKKVVELALDSHAIVYIAIHTCTSAISHEDELCRAKENVKVLTEALRNIFKLVVKILKRGFVKKVLKCAKDASAILSYRVSLVNWLAIFNNNLPEGVEIHRALESILSGAEVYPRSTVQPSTTPSSANPSTILHVTSITMPTNTSSQQLYSIPPSTEPVLADEYI